MQEGEIPTGTLNPKATGEQELMAGSKSHGASRTIVVGVDGSAPSLAALRYALHEASKHNARVLAISAWMIPFDGGAAIATLDLEQAAKDVLVEALDEVDSHDAGVTIETQVILGSPGRALVDAASQRDAFLIAVGTRGHGRVAGLLLGSVSQYVAAHAHCPVVTVHADWDPERSEPGAGASEIDREQPGGPVSVHLEELGEEQCLSLIRSRSYGRLAVVNHGRPEIFPVNYVVDGRSVAFRTGPGIKLDRATMGPVAFEVDVIDDHTHEGWVVQVIGVGRDITEALDTWSEHLRSMALSPWVEGERHSWVVITQPIFSGRRLRRPDDA